MLTATDSAGFNALMLASLNGRANAVNFLIGSGATVNAVSTNGSNAILLAVLAQARSRSRPLFKQEQEIISTLIAANADANAKNTDGVSANSIAERNPKIAKEMGLTPAKGPGRFYIAVMGSPSTGSGHNSFDCTESWPHSWIHSEWKQGLMITSVQHIAGRWCIVMGQNVLGNVAQGFRTVASADDLHAVFMKMQTTGETLTDYATGADDARAVFTNGSGDTDGYRIGATADLHHLIKSKVYAKKFDVERIESVSSDEWIVIYGSAMGYGAQQCLDGSLLYVLRGIHDYWQKGLAVTSLSHQGQEWVVVLSAGSNEQSQTLIEATSYESLKSQIQTAWRNGWHVDIITGGRLSATGLLQ